MERLSADEIKKRLEELDGWRLEGDHIVREFETKNWKTTIFVVNTIAGLAEIHWHHPDLEIGFKRVRVKLTTHEAGGLTERDFRLAKEINKAVEEVLKH